MAYEKTNWQDTLRDAQGNVIQKGTPLNAQALGKIEDGIVQAEQKIDTEIQQVTTQLAQKADGDIYRKQAGGGGGAVNIIAGYSENAIAPSIFASTIGGGGAKFANNVIGGDETTIGNMGVNNVVDPNIPGAHYAHIGGGYDNVNNGLASGINTGMHCLIKKTADHATINGGSYHVIENGSYSSVGGGHSNKINGTHSIIGGGIRNTINNEKATIGGGADNNAIGTGSTVSGGTQNKATNSYTTVSGGINNTSSGLKATVGGGENNIASGLNSYVGGGKGNTASGENSFATSGLNNSATAKNSSAQGEEAKANNPGQQAFASGKFAAQGDAQISTYVLRGQSTSATGKILGTNGTDTNPLIPNSSAVLLKYNVIARSTVGDAKAWSVEVFVKKDATGSVSILGSATIKTIAESSSLSWSVDLLPATASFAIRGNGEADKTINWVAKLETVEVIV